MQSISCLAVFIFSVLITGRVCKMAWTYGFLDTPDHRRSHAVVTPRGGGLAIVIVFWIWIIAAAYFTGLSKQIWMPILPSIAVAGIGFWDDVSSLSAAKRLVVQFVCAALSLYLMGGIQITLSIKDYIVPHELLMLIALIFLVWSVNLYNFMDGVNGLAGFEALTISIFMATISFFDGEYNWSWMWSVLACSVAGFLVWNFPKAKIFLGDVGSYFLGFMFGILLVNSANTRPRWFWCGMILLGYFVVDATITLLVRIWFKQPVFQAHHTHAFQILLRNFRKSHTAVTGLVLCINVFWLLPWALLTANDYLPGFLAMLIAYLPLVIIVTLMKAGRPVD